jgi:anti-anti-sigma factor
MTDMIDISYNDNEQIMYCAFTGHLSADHSPEISEALNKKISEIKGPSQGSPESFKIVFDLENVDFVASSFIRICISAFKEVGHENFSVINTRPIIKKTFAIAGLTDEMDIK